LGIFNNSRLDGAIAGFFCVYYFPVAIHLVCTYLKPVPLLENDPEIKEEEIDQLDTICKHDFSRSKQLCYFMGACLLVIGLSIVVVQMLIVFKFIY
jgi:hypothetical protein